MPYRKTPLVKGEMYHVFNRSIAKQPIFIEKRDYQRALETTSFYRYQKPSLRFSHFKRLPSDQKEAFLGNLKNGSLSVEILAYCLMPNHFHFLLKPMDDGSISKLVSNFQNSYSKYFNTRQERTGSLFQSMFKAVRIESDEQFIHVSRYIHLNPVSSFTIKIKSLESYPWSSFKEYISGTSGEITVNTGPILSYFNNSRLKYKKFVFDQVEYQKKLELIKHLTLE